MWIFFQGCSIDNSHVEFTKFVYIIVLLSNFAKGDVEWINIGLLNQNQSEIIVWYVQHHGLLWCNTAMYVVILRSFWKPTNSAWSFMRKLFPVINSSRILLLISASHVGHNYGLCETQWSIVPDSNQFCKSRSPAWEKTCVCNSCCMVGN